MKFITKTSLVLNIILIAALGFGAYQFIVKGSTAMGPDGRTTILLNGAERARVMGEMRSFVETLQTITQALSENDLKTIAATARKKGMGDAKGETPSFMGKLPLAFKKLGFGLHKKFDLLAESASIQPQKSIVLGRISDVMENCVACHASYSITATD